jgi:hypothetical protein
MIHDQLLTCLCEKHRRFADGFPCCVPVIGIDGVTDGGEESFVVAGPGLWGENNVLELFAAGNLELGVSR